MEPEAKIKIVLVGEYGVGKTSLFYSYADNTFPTDYLATIGVDFRFKRIHIDGRSVKLQLWDTAGQERYRGITQSYYRNADAIVLVFDVTRPETFRALPHWVQSIRDRQEEQEQTQLIVVGNKIDAEAYRMVSQEAAAMYAASLDAPYMEVSAKTAHKLTDLFERIARITLEKPLKVQLPESPKFIRLTEDSKYPKEPKEPRGRSIFSRFC